MQQKKIKGKKFGLTHHPESNIQFTIQYILGFLLNNICKKERQIKQPTTLYTFIHEKNTYL